MHKLKGIPDITKHKADVLCVSMEMSISRYHRDGGPPPTGTHRDLYRSGASTRMPLSAQIYFDPHAAHSVQVKFHIRCSLFYHLFLQNMQNLRINANSYT